MYCKYTYTYLILLHIKHTDFAPEAFGDFGAAPKFRPSSNYSALHLPRACAHEGAAHATARLFAALLLLG